MEVTRKGEKKEDDIVSKIYREYVPPPPIKVIKELLNEDNSNVPGDIVLDEQGKLLKKYFIYSNVADFLKEEYDLWITKIMPRQIYDVHLDMSDGSSIVFENVSYRKPFMRNMKTGKYDEMLPFEALERDRSYMAQVDCDRVHKNPQGKVIKRERMAFCKIPVMIGSVACYLYGSSKTKLLEQKECIVDPHGYFIMEGFKKTILLQEKLQSNRIVIFYDTKSKGLIAKVTCVTIKGSTIVQLSIGKHDDIRFTSHFLGKEASINVFSVFRILGMSKLEEIMATIFQFTPHKKKIEAKLAQTQVGFLISPDDFKEIRQINQDPELTDEKIKEYMFNELFPQISSKDALPKLRMLALMISRFMEVQIGVREMENRDSWANKRIVGPARSIERLFGRSISFHLKNIQKDIGKKITQTQQVFNALSEMEKKIEEDFISSFKGNSWGIKGHYSKENITDYLKVEAPVSIYSQLLRVNTPVNRKATQSTAIREVQGTQARYIDVVKTPEGGNCGIVKYCAITTRISLERDDKELIESLKEHIYDKFDDQHRSVLLVNGKLLGWCFGEGLRKELLSRRRKGKLDYDTGIFLDKNGYGVLLVYTNGERPIVPMLIVDEDTQTLVMERDKHLLKKDYTFRDLINLGMAEYLDPLEAEYSPTVWNTDRLEIVKREIKKMQQDLEKAIGMDDKNEIQLITERIKRAKEKKYTHCDIDPTSILGVSASLIPFAGHNQGPRDVLSCAQGDQALSVINSNHMVSFDKSSKALAFPTRPLVETQMNSILGFTETPSSDSAVVMNGPYLGYTQEDAFVIKKEAIERGLGRYVKYMSYSVALNTTTEYTDEIRKPTPKRGENPRHYEMLNDFGIARLGSVVRDGDYLIGKVRIQKTKVKNEVTGKMEEKTVEENLSVSVGLGDKGVVDRILISFNSENQIIIKIKIRDVRTPTEGDKFSMSRYGQKGTIGKIVPEIDLPRTEQGITPDFIHNTHALPSRMTIGLTLENFVGKTVAMTGRRFNATAFRPKNIDQFEKALTQFGFRYDGDETMYSGITGEQMTGTMFIGPIAYQSLRHHVDDKIQARGCGKVMMETGQPNQGRSNFGAIRFGEQERDAAISHGASAWLKERLCDVSDSMELHVCTTCHRVAIFEEKKKLSCRYCLNEAKFGILRIPRATNLIFQYLEAVNIHIGLVTQEKQIG